MPDVTTPAVVRASNEILRPTADIVAQAYDACRTFVREWAIIDQVLSVPTTDDEIADGSQTSKGADADGRLPLTLRSFKIALEVANQFITWFEANADGRTTPRKTYIDRIAVNSRARF